MSATTRAVLASVTAAALSWPVSVPATIAVSASTAPVTEPPSATVIFFATISPCTVPATTSSPPPTTSPVIFRSPLRIDGAESRPPNPADALSLVPLDLNNALPHFQEFLGIERLAVHHHLVMQVRPRAPASAAELADFLIRADSLAARYGDAVQVSVMRDDAISVVDLDELAIGISGARKGHHTGS